MLNFQIGRLTLKNFLLHWIVAIFLVIISGYSFIMEELDFKKVCFVLIVSIFPGMLGSILLIASVKEFLKAIKEKKYITLIAMILFVMIFTKYYFKLWGNTVWLKIY